MKRILLKMSSRKFIVFLIGTSFLFLGKLSGWQWIALASLWIGGNSLDKFIRSYKEDEQTRY